MLVLLFILLIAADIGFALECRTDCRAGPYDFGRTFNIPDGACPQRRSGDACSIDIELDYHSALYNVKFSTLMLSRDSVYIGAGPYLSYNIGYQCSKSIDCVISYAKNRITEMIHRNYSARIIYDEIAPIIKNPLRNGSIQCYNMRKEAIVCASDSTCHLDYDQRENKFRSRGCNLGREPSVFAYDGGSYLSFKIGCNRDLCNNEETFSQIKNVLSTYGLTDGNGRRIAKGNKQMVSLLLMSFTLIFIIFYFF
ncbi:unnamed protein product [Rotaria socialis]|uniref:Uncharacterized protein n=1 Tax=Rotaria socialis TaxID=392032 RepID=A0A817ZNQ8_9BILA|nr:unnamed protein product [Rotaria socialis]CAF3395473.1 unnamed protein product [Rotaria socialis]CAF3625318.1 unnamed protein product [Rotaria socialis]CAF4302958.1 unnamed protein product [Rotaria socialis]CAF4825047.1 unnamed protein product [Rotaria socialis]